MFSFPPTTGMFRFVGFASISMDAMPAHGGLPHSDTCGSKAVRASPQTFAACRVLRRLREPRHPPYALTRFSLLPAARVPAHRRSCVFLSMSLCLLSLSHPVKEPCGTLPALVENVGLEPTTPGLQSRCSSHLSQSPRPSVVPGRLELPTPTLSVWCSNRLSYGTPSSLAPRAPARLPLCLAGQQRNPPRVLGGVPSRKEVFQPHLPVRLPCYDLAPVTTFALGGSSPTSGARGSHGLTGGVYKARERIHRAMADARLLAIPASRGRVAAPDPDCDRLSGSAPRRRVAALCAGHCSTCVAPDVRAVLI